MKKFLIALIIIILVLAIGVFVLLMLTPNQLGFGDMKFGDISISDLGLGDMKILDIIKNVKSATNVKEADVVKNSFDVKREADVAGEILKDTPIKDDFEKLISDKAYFDEEKEISFYDTTFAYMFDKIASDESVTNEEFKKLRNYKLRVSELTVLKGTDESTVRIIFSADISDYAFQINEKLGFASAFISVPDRVFIVSENTFTVDGEGKITTTPKSIELGGIENKQLGDAIIQAVIGDTSKMNDLNGSIGKAFSNYCGNLGKIGTLKDGAGASGIVDHKITFITYVQEKPDEN